MAADIARLERTFRGRRQGLRVREAPAELRSLRAFRPEAPHLSFGIAGIARPLCAKCFSMLSRLEQAKRDQQIGANHR